MSQFSFLHRHKLHLCWHWQWRLANKPKELLPGTCGCGACWRSLGRSHWLPLFHAELLPGLLRAHLGLCPNQSVSSVLPETKTVVVNVRFFKLPERRLFSCHVCNVFIPLLKMAKGFVAKNEIQLYRYLWFVMCTLYPVVLCCLIFCFLKVQGVKFSHLVDRF